MITIIGNGAVYTNTQSVPFLSHGAVVVHGSTILDVGEYTQMLAKYPDHELIDAEGGLIMPGLVNAHHHFYSAMARGMITANPKVSKNFGEILENLWWKLDSHLTLEEVRYSAAISIIDSLKYGVTTILDHHASFGAIEGSLEEMARCAHDIGVRASMCFEVSDREGEAKAKRSIEENANFIAYAKKGDTTMLNALFGLHASFTLSDKTLDASVKAAGGTGFHVHVAEGIADVDACLKQHGKRVVHRLNDFGILNENSIAVHCIHTDASEHDVLAENRVNVVHNPESNMGNAVGAAPVLKMMQRGINVGLGTDGYTHDMFESLKVVGILQKHVSEDPSVGWSEQFEMLLQNNSNLASKLFGVRLGVIEPGAMADVITLDYDPPTPLSGDNFQGHMLFGLSGPLCTNSMINGRLVMRNRTLLTCDESAVKAASRSLAPNLWARL